MVKHRILFILPSFGIGGTTVSTRNLVSVLDRDKYDITVWALNNNGLLCGMYDDVPQLKTNYIAQALALEDWKKEKGWPRRFMAAIIRFFANHSSKAKLFLIQRAIKKSIGNFHFDTVIACQEGFTTFFTSNISCDNLVAWVRCDYRRYYERRQEQRESFYNKYNHIVCVAEQACGNFLDVYPDLKDRTVCIYNPQDSKLIVSQAVVDDHDERFHTDGTVIVSVGRLSKVKRFVEIPSIARGLIDKGFRFVWYIIGDGEEKTAIAQAIEKEGVGNQVVMLGAKSNPHFYIKQADLYVCLSSSEACPRVINEAKILGTPTVSTDFPTVYEYLEDGENGRIEPLERIPLAISDILTNKDLLNKIKNRIEGFTFDNSCLIEQLEKIL